ncbi:myelin and lymphocyte protein-like [Alosa pseudoharengus]|uniref:myelin and lymphocyte protein-like n=1 Tax=Alosa pseudoharengus TaxID=34774 RepID=UPI003F89203C
MSSSETRSALPTGRGVIRTMPDRLFIAEMVFGGLVWMLLISPGSHSAPVLCWVMFCSITCFLVSTIWLCVFCCGANESRIWLKLDAVYHVLATLMYLSASICLAVMTNALSAHKHMNWVGPSVVAVLYKYFIAATILAFFTTLLYFIHAIYSVMRSRRAPYTAI